MQKHVSTPTAPAALPRSLGCSAAAGPQAGSRPPVPAPLGDPGPLVRPRAIPTPNAASEDCPPAADCAGHAASGPAASAPAPFVSVVVPVRNERGFVACCLDSILANDYPPERLEVLVVDGLSDDGTRAVAERYAARYPGVRVLDNPMKITPAALNLGVRAARGDVIVRCDAHARLAPDYITQCVAWIGASGADNVGGRMRTLPRGGGLGAQAVAAALGHRFGVGNSAFRTAAGEPRWVDTVFGGCYRREVFGRVGEFNERLPRGQDMEFNLRLKRAAGRTLLVPSIRCDYFARCDPRSFLAHSWTNGVWAVRPFVESEIVPVRPRHLVPLAFVLALGLAVAIWGAAHGLGLPQLRAVGLPSLGVEGLGPRPLLLLVTCYLAVALAASTQLAWRRRDAHIALVLPAVFLSLHLAYGLGSAWGVVGAAATIVRRAIASAKRINKR